jgi:hypothetical protein
VPITRDQYRLALHRLLAAATLEAQGQVLTKWAPLFLELSAVVDQASAEDWAQAACWFHLWREEQVDAGHWPHSHLATLSAPDPEDSV